MFEKIDNKLVALIAPVGLVMGLSAGVANAEPNYLMSAGGDVVMNGAGECWNTVGGATMMLEACGDVVAPKEVDSDGDGVVDSRDECPNTPKGVAVTAFGCPKDSDGDGVADYMDKCPGTPRGAKVDASGCEIMGNVTINTTADHFAFDSAELKPAMKSELDNVAAKVKASAGNEQLEVIGHTDSTGPEAYNQMLSERRAQAAADYLSGQGVSNMTVKGMGESAPVADNATREGRAMNRRVEVRTK